MQFSALCSVCGVIVQMFVQGRLKREVWNCRCGWHFGLWAYHMTVRQCLCLLGAGFQFRATGRFNIIIFLIGWGCCGAQQFASSLLWEGQQEEEYYREWIVHLVSWVSLRDRNIHRWTYTRYSVGLGRYAFVPIRFSNDFWVPIRFKLQFWLNKFCYFIFQLLWFSFLKQEQVEPNTW